MVPQRVVHCQYRIVGIEKPIEDKEFWQLIGMGCPDL